MEEPKFHPGEYNDFVRQSMSLPGNVLINDVTLREGEQAADVDFSMKDKIGIVKRLGELGIQQVQCGYPGRSKIDWETIRTIKTEKIPIKTEAIAQVFQKDWKEQIDACVSCQPDSMDLMYPSSPYRLKYVQKVSEQEMLKRSVEAVKYAVNRGVLVRFAPTDSARTRLPFLLEIYERVIEAGAERITLTDTTGNLTPTSTRYLVAEITKRFKVPLQIHCHNDYGLATANTLAAFEAGASILDASINGYGERAGNTPLDELVVALRVFYGMDLGIRLHLLTALSQYLETLSGVPLPAMKPLVGKYAFAHKLDAHVMGVLENPIVYESIAPEVVGNVRKIPMGKYSGSFAIRRNAEALGFKIPDNKLEAIRQEVIDFAVKNRTSLTDEVFREILERNLR